jgi:group I intron endonuclease
MHPPVAIYKIVNAANGKLYLGQTVNPVYRARRHFWKNNGCTKLRNAINKYGKEQFKFSVLCWCIDKEEANEIETLLIALCDTQNFGYNIAPGGFGMESGAGNPFFGKIHTVETRLKISKANRGKKPSEETKAKIAAGNRGRTVSEATKEKLRACPKSDLCSKRTSAANKSRVWSNESRAKLAAHVLGKKMTEETKRKVATANSARVWTDASRAKLAASKTKAKC